MDKIKSPIRAYRKLHGKPSGQPMSLEDFGALFQPPIHKSTVMRWEIVGVPPKRASEASRIMGVPLANVIHDTASKAASLEAAQ